MPISVVFFLVLLVVVLVVSNINALSKYKQAQNKLTQIEDDYETIMEQIEIKEQELTALKALVENSDKGGTK